MILLAAVFVIYDSETDQNEKFITKTTFPLGQWPLDANKQTSPHGNSSCMENPGLNLTLLCKMYVKACQREQRAEEHVLILFRAKCQVTPHDDIIVTPSTCCTNHEL